MASRGWKGLKGTWLLPQGIQQTLGEDHRLFSSSGEAKNECSYECTINTSPYAILFCTGTILLYWLKYYLGLRNILHVGALFKAFIKECFILCQERFISLCPVTCGTLCMAILTVPFRLMVYIILRLLMLLPLEH